MEELTSNDYWMIKHAIHMYMSETALTKYEDYEIAGMRHLMKGYESILTKCTENYKELMRAKYAESIRNADTLKAPGHEPKGSFGI